MEKGFLKQKVIIPNSSNDSLVWPIAEKEYLGKTMNCDIALGSALIRVEFHYMISLSLMLYFTKDHGKIVLTYS